ncbi:MAG: hypothetical protein K2X86_06500 [Cytophagaceae bacterium]|nr:hypothetical protein [Cytophagaceae bacterium]
MEDNKHNRDEEGKIRHFNAGKENPFKVPDGYFEKLPSTLQERISEERKTLGKERLGYLLKPQVAISGLVLAVLILSGILYLQKDTTQIPDLVAMARDKQIKKDQAGLKELNSQIKTEDVKTRHIENIEDDVVLEEIQEEMIPQREEMVENNFPGTEKEEIDYLLDNADLSLIMEELNNN